MLNARTELIQLLEQVAEQAKVIGDGDGAVVQAIDNDIETIRRDCHAYQPVLMFYGTYNAGKSTLINAILGTSTAPTSDRPCTDKVDTYQFGEFTLYDTPGVDAPAEHEQVTVEHLQRAHVVVFVVSTSGNFDEAETIRRLAQIYHSGRPLMIVLNDKGGYGVNSPEVMAAQNQLLRHLAEEVGEREIESKVNVYLVNARTALNGRLQGNETMYRMSGVPGLEEAIIKTLMETTGNRLLLPPVRQLEDLIARLLAASENEMDDPQARYLEKQRDLLTRARRNLLGAIETDVRMMRGRFIGDVATAIQQGQDLKAVMAAYLQEVQHIAERRFRTVSDDIGQELGQLRPPGADGLSSQHQHHLNDDPSGQGSGGGLLDQLNAKQLAKAYRAEDAANVFKAGLLKLREWKVPGIKGRWETTLGRWGGNIARGVGVALQVAIVAYDIHKARQAQAAAEHAERDRRRQLQSAAEGYVIDCEFEVLREVPESVDEVFSPLMQPVNENLGTLTDHIAELRTSRRRLTEISDALQRLKLEVVRSQNMRINSNY